MSEVSRWRCCCLLTTPYLLAEQKTKLALEACVARSNSLETKLCEKERELTEERNNLRRLQQTHQDESLQYNVRSDNSELS